MEFMANNYVWHVYSVHPRNHNLLRNDLSGYALGMCDSNIKCIFINSELSDRKRELVLAHEIYHAFLFSYGVRIENVDLEEDLCNLFAEHGRDMILLLDRLLMEILEV